MGIIPATRRHGGGGTEPQTKAPWLGSSSVSAVSPLLLAQAGALPCCLAQRGAAGKGLALRSRSAFLPSVSGLLSFLPLSCASCRLSLQFALWEPWK